VLQGEAATGELSEAAKADHPVLRHLEAALTVVPRLRIERERFSEVEDDQHTGDFCAAQSAAFLFSLSFYSKEITNVAPWSSPLSLQDRAIPRSGAWSTEILFLCYDLIKTEKKNVDSRSLKHLHVLNLTKLTKLNKPLTAH
jgi:hypothetical protein